MSTDPRPLRRSGLDALRELDPRVRIGAAIVAGVVVLAAIVALAMSGNNSSGTVARPTPTAIVTTEPSATPPRARTTPPGTAAPRPKNFVGISASIAVSPPPAPRSSPTPEPGLWRLEGYIVDEQGKPVESVCVVIGPVGCQAFSPHTDERGHYFVDIAAVGSGTVAQQYDFYFEYPGRESLWLRMTPTGSTTFNAVMKRT